ncbi:MAG: 4-(cytidine 5'-diphospho)-2-C-methyl-D-erythritol kinase [Bacteroidales bacterium]|jgi:4-diphosphocytidyl-2-C-methyl-D-erythritol kinase|nr:4-(cytidine 5'-diphospho)-2-C-methyl-D-erythritol kinase [Bacteroidales bacterium]
MVIFPTAKINIGLYISGKRNDGFHEIETVFYPVKNFSDVLEIVPAKQRKAGCYFQQSGNMQPLAKGENLVEKAYQLLSQQYQLPPVNIFLHKNIPSMAGLGGGSSDAACCLLLLNKLFSINLNINQLKHFATQLGSDCAFFIENRPALGKGKGDELHSIDIEQLNGKYIHIITPPITISTSAAYKNCIISAPPQPSLQERLKAPLSEWKDLIVNDFEKTLFPLYPQLTAIKADLYRKGAIYASLSGSGSAIYGIFEQKR